MMKTTGLFLCMTMLYSTICEAQSAPDSLQEQIQTITRNYSEGHTIFPLSNGFAVVKNKAIELQNRTKQTIPLRYGKRVANIRQRGSIALIEEPVQGSDLIHMRAYSLKQNKDVFEKLMHLRVTDFLNDHTLYTQALTLQDIRGTLEIINLEQGTKQTPDFLGKSPIFIAKAMDVHRLFILVEKRKQVDTKLGPMTQAAGTNFYVYNTIQQTIKDSGYLDGTHLISAVIPTIYEYNGQIYFILGDPKGDLKYVYHQ